MILVTGPESTGKSTLAQWLSSKLGRNWMPEYSRLYLEEYGPDYTYADIEIMALKHAELVLAAEDNKLILDTYLLNYKIWSEYKYGRVSQIILGLLSECQIDTVLLMKPDIPWVLDPLRENPNDRDRLFEIYVKELDALGWDYNIITGNKKDRSSLALSIVDPQNDNE